MRSRLSVLLLPIALAACQDSLQPAAPSASSLAPTPLHLSLGASGPERVVPGEVLVKFEADADPSGLARAYGVSLARRGYGNSFAVLKGAVGSEHALAARLAADPHVVYAEPNYLRQVSGSGAINSALWAFYNPGGLTMTYTRGQNQGLPVTSSTSTNDADEDGAPDGTYGSYGASGSRVVVGSIDTGVDYTHQEFLPGQIIRGYDWYSGDNDPMDEEGHGTHTTGTMVGQTVGVAGVSGAGGNVQVYVQRVCGRNGCPTSAIVSAIRAAADQGVVAMNLSLGGTSESQAEADAIAYARSKNALVIASAGNDGTSTISCPACDPNAISVAALNWQGALSYYSNWGAGLDISAAGGEMYSNTSEEGGIYSSIPGGYAYYQGTSMAAPQVTGTAGVVASVKGLRGDALRNQLLSTADPLGDANLFGSGRVNTYRAVTSATLSEGSGTTEPTAPSGLSATNASRGPNSRASLAWTSGTAAIVDVWRNGSKLVSGISNTGAYTDNLGKGVSGSFTYQVCIAGSAAGSSTGCTGTASVVF